MSEGFPVWAIVPAAGSGQRFCANTPKQYSPLLGEKTVLEITVEKLLSLDDIEGVIVVIAEGDQRLCQLPVSFDSRVSTVVGGKERCDSVLNALAFLSKHHPSTDRVLIHDAARPCFSLSLVKAMISSLRNDVVGGVMAVQVSDTLKESVSLQAHSEQPIVKKTLDRSSVWQAQTPQLFPLGLLVDALIQASKKGDVVTDESSAMEAQGFNPKIFVGNPFNLKITRQADLVLADLILRKNLDD